MTVPIDVASGSGRQEIIRVGASEAGAELTRHLADNRLHYSQAVWRSLDASAVALLLSRYTWEGRPVSNQVEPNPILVSGNYLVFRMPGFSRTNGVPERAIANEEANLAAARAAWDAWLADHGVVLGRDAAAEQLVPIPTGGVFAAAVLGRSNSAEKLDATRFWNWQDSPIPLQPPEIAAITMGSRHDPGTTPVPGQLGQPVLNIVNPTNLPDPTGRGPILGAVQNGSMFRDMSGLAASIGLAQATAGEATTAGTEAGRQAAANLAVAAQKEIEMARIAAQVALASMGMPAGSAGTPTTHSEMGALLNAGDERERRRGAAGTGGPGVGSGGTAPGTGDGGDGGGGTEDGGAGDDLGGDLDAGDTAGTDVMPGVPAWMDAMGSGGTAYERALWGPLGMPAGNLVMAASKKRPAAKTTTVEIAVAASFPSPWSNATEETAALREENNAHWSPTINDFRSAAGTIVRPDSNRGLLHCERNRRVGAAGKRGSRRARLSCLFAVS